MTLKSFRFKVEFMFFFVIEAGSRYTYINMASELNFVEYIAEQIETAGNISYRKMFGEFALYCNTKVVALICNNQLFIKPTQAGKSFIGEVVEAPPYSGAKPYYLIEDQVENSRWLSRLVEITEGELPIPKPKKSRKKG